MSEDLCRQIPVPRLRITSGWVNYDELSSSLREETEIKSASIGEGTLELGDRILKYYKSAGDRFAVPHFSGGGCKLFTTKYFLINTNR